MRLTTTHPLQQLTERIADWRDGRLEVDRSARIIRNVALTGRQSRNGYQYTPEALRGAVTLYENKPVFLDHAERVTKPFERSTRDLVGSIVNARFEEERIRGDVQVLETEAGRTFLALAEAEQVPVGMSHVVLARRSSDRRQVELIDDVVSVDVVMYPATTKSFRESVQSADLVPLPESFESLWERIREQWETEGAEDYSYRGLYPGQVVLQRERDEQLYVLGFELDGSDVRFENAPRVINESDLNALGWSASLSEVASLRAELADARRELEQLQETESRTQSRMKLLSDSGLPELAITEVFRKQIVDAIDEEACRELIRDRQHVLRSSAARGPSSHSRNRDEERGVSDVTIVRAIRGSRRITQGRVA